MSPRKMAASETRRKGSSDTYWVVHVNGAVLCCMVAIVLVNYGGMDVETGPSGATYDYNTGVVVPVPAKQSIVDESLNEFDKQFAELFYNATLTLEKGKKRLAEDMFSELFGVFPESPFVNWNYGRLLFERGGKENDTNLRKKAAGVIKGIISLPNLTKMFIVKVVKFYVSVDRTANKENLWGHVMKLHPDDKDIKREYLYAVFDVNNKTEATWAVIQELLGKEPKDPVLNVYHGRFVGRHYKDYSRAITLIEPFITAQNKHIQNYDVYTELGDAYIRTGDIQKSTQINQKGVRRGLFLSEHQRCRHQFDKTVTATPTWLIEDTPYSKYFESLDRSFDVIKQEGEQHLRVKYGYKADEGNLVETGEWKHFKLYEGGVKLKHHCRRAPKTCDIFKGMREMKACPGCQMRFSAMLPGTHVWPHCGVDNGRIRVHLVVQGNGHRLRVMNETWEMAEGDMIIFDDSFEHELWNDGPGNGLVFVADFLHPELAERNIKNIESEDKQSEKSTEKDVKNKEKDVKHKENGVNPEEKGKNHAENDE